MPATAKWLDDDQMMIYVTVTGRWKLSEIETCLYNITLALPDTPERLYIIGDHLDAQGMPLGSLVTARRLVDSGVFNVLQHVVIIGAPPLFVTLYNTVARIHPDLHNRYQFVDTRETALQCLYEKKAQDDRVQIDIAS